MILHPPKKMPISTAKIHMKKVTFVFVILIKRNITNKWANNLQEGFKVAKNEVFAFILILAPFVHALADNEGVV